MWAAGAEDQREETSETAWTSISHPVKISKGRLACIYLPLDLAQLLVTNFPAQRGFGYDREPGIALAGLSSGKNDHARSLGLDKCIVSLGAVQGNINDQPRRIGTGKEGIDSVAQGEEATLVFLQRSAGQVQGLYELLVMAIGIVPDYDAAVVHLFLDHAAQVIGDLAYNNPFL